MVSKTGRNVTHVTIANMWQKWASIPLVIPASRTGRFKKVVSLKIAGIEVHQINVGQNVKETPKTKEEVPRGDEDE